MNIWKKIKKPIMCLAPMEDVTDIVFRELLTHTYKPDIYFTEFVNVTGFLSTGKAYVAKRLEYTEAQHPIIAQVWGTVPEDFRKAAEEISKMGFDGIDINMGCPQRNIVKTGGASALINTPELAKEIIKATKEGAGDLPVSVKTRIGYNSIQTEEWITFLLEQDLDAITIHGRTRKEMSLVPAHWDEIGKAVEIRNKLGKDTLIIGNGDVKDYGDGLSKVKEFGVDGVMIGRGIFQNLWAFDPLNYTKIPSEEELKNLLRTHINLWIKYHGDNLKHATLKRFFKIYITDFRGSKELRNRIMNVEKPSDVFDIIGIK